MNGSIKTLLKIIDESGYKSYLVGGYVRDILLGISNENMDLDIVTDAPNEVILNLFKEYKPKVLKYDTISFKYNGYSVDVARMRCETYINNELKVEFINDLETDAKRRDFSINAIYIDFSSNYIDYFNGLNDIKNKRIKFIGNMYDRLKEDPSRLLRYIYFIVKYDLNYDVDEFDNIKSISKETINMVNKLDVNKYISRILSLEKFELLSDILHKLDIYYELFQSDYCKEYDSKYSFIVGTKYKYYKLLKSSDQAFVEDVANIVNSDHIDMVTLFFNSIEVVKEAAKVLNIESNYVDELYSKMLIHDKKDLNISKMEIARLLNLPIDENVNRIYNKIVHDVLYNELENDKFKIVEYIRRGEYNE